jgi:putative hydrolase of the HAD superfamily
MIGDNLEWEVEAPQKLGIYSVWVDSQGKGLPKGSNITPNRTIRSITELI